MSGVRATAAAHSIATPSDWIATTSLYVTMSGTNNAITNNKTTTVSDCTAILTHSQSETTHWHSAKIESKKYWPLRLHQYQTCLQRKWL